MFVLKKELVFHNEGKVAIIPRESILGFIMEPTAIKRHRRAKLVAGRTDGAKVSFDLGFLDVRGGRLVAALEEWKSTGRWELA